MNTRGGSVSRNYGIGSRVIADAGRIALFRAADYKVVSFDTARTVSGRFNLFAKFAKGNHISKMENITSDDVKQFGKGLAQKVRSNEITASHAQNSVSAVNTVMRIATTGEWKSISPTKDCKIPKRCNVRKVPTVQPSVAKKAILSMRLEGYHREASIAELCLLFGCRSKEASLLSPKVLLKQAKKKGYVTLVYGTKGGKKRTFPITSAEQLEVLERAVQIQGKGRSLIPSDMNWKKWRKTGLQVVRNHLKKHGIKGHPELRSSYAAGRYKVLTGLLCPANGGIIIDKKLDVAARLIIAKELGHRRIDVTNAYLGGRR